MILSYKNKFLFIKTKKTAGTSIEVNLSSHCGDSDIVGRTGQLQSSTHRMRNIRAAQNGMSYFGEHHGAEYIKSILDYFKGDISREKLKEHYLYNYNNVVVPHKKVMEGFNRVPNFSESNKLKEDIWEDYFKFSAERNPWDKTVSMYVYLKKHQGVTHDFETWVKDGDKLYDRERWLPKCWEYYTLDDEVVVDYIIRYENLEEDYETVCNSLGIDYEPLSKEKFLRKDKSYTHMYNEETKQIVANNFEKEIEYFKYRF